MSEVPEITLCAEFTPSDELVPQEAARTWSVARRRPWWAWIWAPWRRWAILTYEGTVRPGVRIGTFEVTPTGVVHVRNQWRRP